MQFFYLFDKSALPACLAPYCALAPYRKSTFVLIEMYHFACLSAFLQYLPAASMQFCYLSDKSALHACSILQILQAAASHVL